MTHRIPKDFSPKELGLKPLEVEVINDNFDRAFKAFKMLVQKERILSIYKEKQRYEKPSDKRRRKAAEARQRSFELEMKQKKILSGEYDKERTKKKGHKDGSRSNGDNL